MQNSVRPWSEHELHPDQRCCTHFMRLLSCVMGIKCQGLCTRDRFSGCDCEPTTTGFHNHLEAVGTYPCLRRPSTPEGRNNGMGYGTHTRRAGCSELCRGRFLRSVSHTCTYVVQRSSREDGRLDGVISGRLVPRPFVCRSATLILSFLSSTRVIVLSTSSTSGVREASRDPTLAPRRRGRRDV